MAEAGSPLNVRLTHVHSANVAGGRWIVVELQAAGYPVVRSYSVSRWSRQSEAAATCDLTGDQDTEADQRPTANNFAAGKADAMTHGTHVLATGSDLDFVNAVRAGAGHPPADGRLSGVVTKNRTAARVSGPRYPPMGPFLGEVTNGYP